MTTYYISVDKLGKDERIEAISKFIQTYNIPTSYIDCRYIFGGWADYSVKNSTPHVAIQDKDTAIAFSLMCRGECLKTPPTQS